MKLSKITNSFFTKTLLKWHYNYNERIMPWAKEKDTYKIWISEIILQQTRVEHGIGYYTNFVKKFPTLETLALADDQSVFKMWEGLGYYSRCKNLIHTAKKIFFELNGKFPDQYETLLSLKGIGPYTAAAISSFAYGLPHAVVDGNVFRVLARFFGESIPIDSSKGKLFFENLANQLLFKNDPASYNQAIMDFGATVCKPRIAECQNCMLKKNCIAYNQGTVNKLPIKEKQLIRKNRFFTYFIFSVKDKFLVTKRIEKDIWQNLYEFYLYQSSKMPVWKKEEINQWLQYQMGIEEYKIKNVSGIYKQQLTHQNLEGNFITIELISIPLSLQHYQALSQEELGTVPFPKFINQYLEKGFATMS